jgi:hypothetical protein
MLIVNASEAAIASGETNAELLRTLYKKGVQICDCVALHAKVVLLDDLAIVSSGNMSNSSANGLVEAAVMTDHRTTVSGVASFLEQLSSKSTELKAKHLSRLCKIKVVRRGAGQPGLRRNRKPKIRRLGNRTWLVGVRELVRGPAPDEQSKIKLATEVLRSKTGDKDLEPDWIRWAGRSRFRRECREGDSVIQIWRTNKATRPSCVCRSSPILLKQSSHKWTRFYLRESSGSHAEMPWGKFKNLLKELGYTRQVGPGSTVLLEPDLADAIDRKWTSVQ